MQFPEFEVLNCLLLNSSFVPDSDNSVQSNLEVEEGTISEILKRMTDLLPVRLGEKQNFVCSFNKLLFLWPQL